MVIVEHMGDIPNLSNFLPVGPVWCIQSNALTVKDGLTVTRWYFNVFCFRWQSSIQHLSKKTQFPGFLFQQVV